MLKAKILWALTFIMGYYNHSTIHNLREKKAKEKIINWIKWFSPKNESIWEHVKMGYFPLLLLTLIFDIKCNIGARIIGLWIHIIVMLCLYYFYTYFITFRDVLKINIPLFGFSLFIGYLAENYFINYNLLWLGIPLTLLIVFLSYIDHEKTKQIESFNFSFYNFPDNKFFDMFEDKKITNRFLCLKSRTDGYCYTDNNHNH